MKRKYVKPCIAVEELTLDMPIANGCDVNNPDVMDIIYELKFFTIDHNCEEPQFDFDDTMCYLTNTLALFRS